MLSHAPRQDAIDSGTVILSENATKVLESRYLKKNHNGDCTERPGDLFRRVSGTIATIEKRYGANEAVARQWGDRFYRLMTSGDFMPNSPTLMNAGREMGMLSACFVLPVRDSINEIFDSIKHTALIQKAGGGTGFAFDELRPTGDYIKSSGGTTSGPITFWRAFSEATNAIQQGAFRRGANMGMMYIHHPDILKFLHAKQDLSQFTNYNISVKVTNAWMGEFIDDADSPHVVRNPRTGQAFLLPRDLDIWSYDIRSLIPIDCVDALPEGDRSAYYTSPQLTGAIPAEHAGKVYTKREIWRIVVENAWKTGEPGVVFIDRINEHNPTPHVGRIEATNPCGEQPLLPYEACNLGSINLGNFIEDACTPQARVNWDRLREVAFEATRFLDNVVDANNYPLPEIEHMCKSNRKIGLGIMGFADALFMLGVPYNSDEGVAWGERFMQFVNDEAHNCSEELARERGCFPNWKGSHWQTRHNRLMRNACSTTVAPTGTISIIANCSGGIEPMFSLAFIRNVLRGQKHGDKPLVEVNETFRRVAEQRGLLSDELLERIAGEGTLAHIDEVPDDLKRVFVCAHDIAPEWHMQMQAGFQRHNDSSISKTINFPRAASVEDVEEIYKLAFKLDCKGVTVYRDGCREHQPMALKNKESERATERRSDEGEREAAVSAGADQRADGEKTELVPAAIAAVTTVTNVPKPQRIEPRDLPEIVSGLRIRQMTPFGNMHVKITVDPREDRELEVFAQLGKGGDVATSDLEAICRMISLWLRSGGSLKLVIKQLEGIGSSLQIPTRTGRIMSLGDGVATALKKYVRAKERFGLRSLLLGEIDLAELDRPQATPGVTLDHSPRANGNGGNGGNGTSNGNGKSHGDGHGGNGGGGSPSRIVAPARDAGGAPQVLVQSEAQIGDVIRATFAEPRAAAVPGAAPRTVARQANGNGNGHGHGNGNGHHDAGATTAVIDAAPVEDILARREQGLTAGRTKPTQNTTGAAASGTTAGGAAQTAAAPRAAGRDTARHYIVKCPECGGALAMQEGCRKCYVCGWAAC